MPRHPTMGFAMAAVFSIARRVFLGRFTDDARVLDARTCVARDIRP